MTVHASRQAWARTILGLAAAVALLLVATGDGRAQASTRPGVRPRAQAAAHRPHGLARARCDTRWEPCITAAYVCDDALYVHFSWENHPDDGLAGLWLRDVSGRVQSPAGHGRWSPVASASGGEGALRYAAWGRDVGSGVYWRDAIVEDAGRLTQPAGINGGC